MRLSPSLFIALTLLASCSSVDEETQVTVALESETEVPKELDAFVVRVLSTRTGELRFSQTYVAENGNRFPTTLAVIPANEDSLESPVRIEVEGRKAERTFLKRVSTVSYVRGRNLLLNIALRMACFQFRDCGPTQTCAGGQCVSADVPAATLPDYEPRLVFAEPGQACFDEEACLASSEVVKVEEDCTFPVPEGDANVAIRWDAAPGRLLALESEDPQEGWSRVANGLGRLSQGACDSHFRRTLPGSAERLVPDWARQVYVAPGCAPKTRTVPYCRSSVTGHAGIGAVR